MRTIVNMKPAEEFIVYETSDGEQFTDKSIAEDHELLLKLKYRSLKSPFSNCRAFYLSSENELTKIEYYLSDVEDFGLGNYKSSEFIYPDWFVSHEEKDCWIVTIKPLSIFITDVNNQLEDLK